MVKIINLERLLPIFYFILIRIQQYYKFTVSLKLKYNVNIVIALHTA